MSRGTYWNNKGTFQLFSECLADLVPVEGSVSKVDLSGEFRTVAEQLEKDRAADARLRKKSQ